MTRRPDVVEQCLKQQKMTLEVVKKMQVTEQLLSDREVQNSNDPSLVLADIAVGLRQLNTRLNVHEEKID